MTLDADVQKQLEAPMPWIGIYVAAASLVCALAMAADVFVGFRAKKLWFPSKYFSINAASLSLLAVAMKLPIDLTTRMYAPTDRLAKVSSLLFMSTAMGNFMTSLGSMTDKEILLNVIALGILVITVLANVCIQIIQMRHFLGGRVLFEEEMIASFFILLLLFMLCASAIMVPTTKRYLEFKYQEMVKLASEEEVAESEEFENLRTNKLRAMIKKYWVMAETSGPQYVIARSVTCSTSGVVCLLMAFVLVEAHFRMAIKCKTFSETASSYGRSTIFIVLAQSAGVIVGTIAPGFRWLTAVNFSYSHESQTNFQNAFTVENYWTQRLVDWKERSFSLQIRNRRWRKFIHDAKGLILDLVIRAQILTVLSSKLVRILSVWFVTWIVSSFHSIKRLKIVFNSSRSHIHEFPESAPGPEVNSEEDLTRYVLLLEGEVEQHPKTLKSICRKVDKVIEIGKRQQPKNLKNLLLKINNFSNLTEIDDFQIPTLHSQETPDCWSLHVATLTSIAIALPNIPRDSTNWLLNGVEQGLFYVKLIEKCLDRNGVRLNIRNAADVLWVAVELYQKWQDNDLQEMSQKGRSSREVVQELLDQAEKTVTEFKRNVKDCRMKNPLNWPVEAVAANSMYRTTRTILLVHERSDPLSDEGLFNHISTMIAHVLADCLTNLTHVITMKCHQNAIEEREQSVHQAGLLLGETEEILQIIQKHIGQSLNPEWTTEIRIPLFSTFDVL